MLFQNLKDILTLLVPIGLVALIVGYVKLVFLKEEGSAFIKITRFLASVLFGIVTGYISSKFYGQGGQLITTGLCVLLADQITNKIDKTGLAEIINYVKRKQENTQSDNTNNNGTG